MYCPRSLEKAVSSASEQFPVLLLTGARQVGKTTLLRHLSEGGRAYVTLDDPPLLNLAQTDPALFMQRFAPPVLIDEIQYAPGLLPYIKMAADRAGERGLFWLTGSQQFHYMKGVSESLAGRVALLHMYCLSRRELLGHAADDAPFLPTPEEIGRRVRAEGRLTLRELYRLIWRGGLPAIALNRAVDRDLFYGSYAQTYLERDVRDLARVGDRTAFVRFLRAAAARTGQILNLSDLARDADVSPHTAKTWLAFLEAAGTIYLLEPYHTNVTQRLVKAPKLYFLDTGLAAYLTEWASSETLEAGAMSGGILETWAVGEVLKSYAHAGRQPPLYYYRDKDGREIDLLLVRDGTIYPVEIKKTASPKADDVRHFAALARLGLPVGPGALICLVERALPLSATVEAAPAWGL